MKILYFVDSLKESGGIQRMLTNKVNYLASLQEYEIHIISYDNKDGSPFFPLHKKIQLHNIEIKNFNKSFLEKLCITPSIINKSKQLIDKIKPDIIVNENMKTMTFLLPFIALKIPKIYVIHFSFDGLMLMSQNLYKNKIIKRLITKIRFTILSKYNKFIVLTEEDERKWNLPNTQVIPNFTSIDNTIKTDLSNKKAIFVGRFSPEKDLPTLIRAWNIVHQSAPEWQLELYGNGIEKDKVIKLIKELKLEDHILLKGNSSQVESVYRSASLLVLSSKFEGFVLVVLEALTMGVPCIAFDIPGCNNLIKNNINGYLASERTHEALAEKIIKYIKSNNSEKLKMQQRIPETIERYSQSNVMQQWMDLFHECIRINK